jgi:hypothetical protein
MSKQTEAEFEEHQNMLGIASVKGHNFAQKYNTLSGKVEDRANYHALKEGYTAGFLAGFVYKITGDKDL